MSNCSSRSASRDLAKRPARRLSGGEQQRLALARALARDPELLLLDEPTASLDPAATRGVEEIVRAAALSGIKVVMASHDLGQVRRLAGKVMFLVRGAVRDSAGGGIPQHPVDSGGSGLRARRSRRLIPGVSVMLNRRLCSHLPFRLLLARHAGAGAGQIHRRRIDHLDAGFRPVRSHPAAVQGENGIDVKVIAQGTGQALDTARRGDADVVLVHAKPQEEKFVADGFGVKRLRSDVQRFRADRAERPIRPASRARTISSRHCRRSGRRPRRLSHAATSRARMRRSSRCGSRPASTSMPAKGPWYREIGQGMGAALNMAGVGMPTSCPTAAPGCRSRIRGDLVMSVEGDRRLFNQYGVILVNPAKHPAVKKELGQTFIDWLLSDEGQAAIAGYKINGKQLFFPNADRKAS